MYLNKVELIGFLGRDAETKTTPNRKAVTTFSIATKTSYKKDGERQERTEWHRVQAWGKLGEYAAAFKKGAHICVEADAQNVVEVTMKRISSIFCTTSTADKGEEWRTFTSRPVRRVALKGRPFRTM